MWRRCRDIYNRDRCQRLCLGPITLRLSTTHTTSPMDLSTFKRGQLFEVQVSTSYQTNQSSISFTLLSLEFLEFAPEDSVDSKARTLYAIPRSPRNELVPLTLLDCPTTLRVFRSGKEGNDAYERELKFHEAARKAQILALPALWGRGQSKTGKGIQQVIFLECFESRAHHDQHCKHCAISGSMLRKIEKARIAVSGLLRSRTPPPVQHLIWKGDEQTGYPIFPANYPDTLTAQDVPEENLDGWRADNLLVPKVARLAIGYLRIVITNSGALDARRPILTVKGESDK
ncbi:hypothetical protein BV25DRAFT_1228936 [Artomyces pyxidatus]|uniref:Uncharacterized protein n=1 Tax=Artomyces pyxidatus TaxID=48021 RepID=A0ACB8SQS0_9AGAM|nr:hypothetical protein BV25DRAFT_1228936 [Artomyces pyxidatus]